MELLASTYNWWFQAYFEATFIHDLFFGVTFIPFFWCQPEKMEFGFDQSIAWPTKTTPDGSRSWLSPMVEAELKKNADWG